MTDAILYIIISAFVFIIIVVVLIIKSFNECRRKLDNSIFLLNISLKKRWNLVPRLIEIVKGYVGEEKETLEEVIRLRNRTYDNMDIIQKIEVDNKLKLRIEKIILWCLDCTELKTNKKFIFLKEKLNEVDCEILLIQKNYKDCLKSYDERIKTFPSNMIAKYNVKER